MLLLLLLTPLYINFLGIESYGLIGFYTSWVAILGILDMGISATATREIAWLSARPEERGGIPALVRSLEVVYWGIVLILGMGLLAGAWFFGASWFQAKDLPTEAVRDALMLMAVSLVVQVPAGLYTGGLMGLQRQVQSSGLLALFGTLRGVGAIVVLWKIYPDIRAFFLWQIIVSVLQTSVIRWSLWKKLRIDGYPAKFSGEALHSVKGFAGGMTLITALSLVVSQADKMILSRVVPLEIFGYYMLAWSVASGLMLVATPLMQAFGPHFTKLTSSGDHAALDEQVRFASQLMSVLVLPPAALIVFLSEPILLVWLGNPTVAASAAPILAILVVGMMLIACSYPALSILYSKNQLRPVIAVNLVSLIVLLPLMVWAVLRFGVMGAAFCWGLFGLILFFSYRIYGLHGLSKEGVFVSSLRDFAIPCATAFAVAGIIGHWLTTLESRMAFVVLLTLGLVFSWIATCLVCKDLRSILMEKMKWKKKAALTKTA